VSATPSPVEPGAEAGVEGGLQVGLWMLAWPSILANLSGSIAGVVDLKIVGLLGPSAVAATGAGMRIYFASQAAMIAITAGTTALVARAIGARNPAEAERVTRASLAIALAFSLVLTMLCVALAGPLARSFDLDPDTVQQAERFIRVLSLFNAGFAAFGVLGASLRAAGDARTPLWVGVGANVVNAVLDYALVLGHLGAPALGVVGAAYATGTAFALSGIALVVLWRRSARRLRPDPERALTRSRVAELLRIGFPAALEQMLWQGGLLAFAYVMIAYGSNAYAAYNIGAQILSFSFLVGFGFSVAASTLVGQHLGARDPAGARAAGWRAMRWSISAMVLLGALILATGDLLARAMIDDAEVVHLTRVFLFMLGVAQPLMAIEYSLSGALRGAGDTRFPLLTTLVGLVCVRLGLACLGAWLGLDIAWIYSALILDYAAKALLLTLRFRGEAWLRAI
jgi:putative MATE family efflux protein